jgi:ABC-type multidrug transport system ATPase subunit
MIISELEIKSYKSFGNNPQIIKLNTQKGELVLLAGINGAGKSLIPSTEIEIEFEINDLTEEDRQTFYAIMDRGNKT